MSEALEILLKRAHDVLDDELRAAGAEQLAKSGAKANKEREDAMSKLKKQAEAIALLKGAVDTARYELSQATDEFERMRKAEELRGARQRYATAKLIAQANAQANGRIRGTRFGPNSTELFKGIDTIGDDASLRYR